MGVHHVCCAGNLPEFRGGPTGLPLLSGLSLNNNSFQGALPESYASLANVTELYLDGNRLSGGLPDSWGADTAFGQLSYLYLSSNNLSGVHRSHRLLASLDSALLPCRRSRHPKP